MLLQLNEYFVVLFGCAAHEHDSFLPFASNSWSFILTFFPECIGVNDAFVASDVIEGIYTGGVDGEEHETLSSTV